MAKNGEVHPVLRSPVGSQRSNLCHWYCWYREGEKASYKAVVQGNGNLLIGKAYTAILELNPGDEYEIKLGRKQIRLIPVGGSEEED